MTNSAKAFVTLGLILVAVCLEMRIAGLERELRNSQEMTIKNLHLINMYLSKDRSGSAATIR